MEVTQGALVGKRLGNYELLALLAIGGTAEIYLARIGGEAGFEKYVVVKCLLDHLADEEDYVRMFLDEARLGAQLDHSNIVQTLELGEHNGRYFMAMEYLAGMSLAQLARKTNERVAGGKLPVELVLGMAAQTCAGLHYAHRKHTASGESLNLVHRDISPQNLVVSFDGVLKIVDFGIAKANFRETHTQSGTIKGKFAYMSPEQCLAKEVDFRTDIFALGVILHELLTARRLFKRTTTYETYEAIIKGDVPTPSSVNPNLDSTLDEVVMKALRYDKKDRYDSAETLGQALLGVLHKRGRAVNASDIANFYEAHFDDELRDHHMRMRSLITGKKASVVGDESINWDGDEIDELDADEDSSEIELDLDASAIEDIQSIQARAPEAKEPEAPRTIPEDDGATRIEEFPLSMSPKPSAKARAATSASVQSTMIDASWDMDPAAGAPAAAKPAAKPAAKKNDGGAGSPAAAKKKPGHGPTLVDAGTTKPPLPRVTELEPGPKPGGGPTLVDAGLGPGKNRPDASGAMPGPTLRDKSGGPPAGASAKLAPPARTSGPTDKTIAPGQLLSPLAPPVVRNVEPKGRGKRRSENRPTQNLGPKTPLTPLEAQETVQNLDSPVSGEFQVPKLDGSVDASTPVRGPISEPIASVRPETSPPAIPASATARPTPKPAGGPRPNAAGPAASDGKPRRTVMGVSPFSQPGAPRPRPPSLADNNDKENRTLDEALKGLPLKPPPRQPTASSARRLYDAPPRKDGGAPVGPSAGVGPPESDASGARAPVPPDTIPPVGQRQPMGTGPQRPMTADPGMRGSSGQLPRLAPPQSMMPRPTQARAADGPQLWLLGVVFAISLGVGLGATLLIASLAG